ncbi:DUF6493 family protein [Spongiactinospora sp. TRM90649]|uniref:DUF7824 domain-containing protein n=1 Tax=Spongiactinospora sp. TRM90649 TaxID=3031114 RepID=UPI0023F80935|nr:DUF6493 family protein [Spongiactinospora sp. TRM90649]MDF5755747.1 DUF6493 family protein [Spongiactinospora sp. TRM90649]
MTAWDDVRGLIDRGDADLLVEALVALGDGERKEVAARLRGHIGVLAERAEAKRARRWEESLRIMKREPERWNFSSPRFPHEPWEDWAELTRLAGAGALSAVTDVVSWVNRRDLLTWGESSSRGRYGDPVLMVRLLSRRPSAWQAELAGRLARRVRGPRDAGTALALAMLRHTGVTPPEHDPLVVAWVSEGAAKASDPLARVLLPRLFEAEGVGRALQHERALPDSPWLSGIMTMIRRGTVDRAMVVDGCVRRFLRGGDAQELRFFSRLHELLDPTDAEAETHRRDYLRMLPNTPALIAESAVARLRRLPVPEPDDLAEALESLLFRPEAKLAKAALSWLDKAVRERPGLADALVPALVLAFRHESYEVKSRAARLAVKHRARLGPDAAGQVGAAVGDLPSALGAPVAEAFGGEPPAEESAEVFVPPPLREPASPEPFPPLYESGRQMAPLAPTGGWRETERWLEGFVRLVRADREALRASLAPGYRGAHLAIFALEMWAREEEWIAGIAQELIGADDAPEGDGTATDAVWALVRASTTGVSFPGRRARLPRVQDIGPLHLLRLRRCAEILHAFREDRLPPVLLATPTLATGALDPEVLVERLELCQAAGVEPLPADLAQALLRLPRGSHPPAADRAGRLTSAAGRTAARLLASDGLPDPAAVVRWTRWHNGTPRPMIESLPPAPTGVELVDEVLGAPPTPHHVHGDMSPWPGVLPSHREVVAVHMAAPQGTHWRHPIVTAEHVAALAAGDGPMGPASALLLARLLPEGDSAPGVAVLLSMAGRGDLPVTGLGEQLALLARHSGAKVAPIATALRDAAAGGAHAAAWRVLAALLAALLPAQGERPRAGLAELTEAAATVAEWTGAHTPIPAVTRIAAGTSTAAYARACRRLHDHLARP